MQGNSLLLFPKKPIFFGNSYSPTIPKVSMLIMFVIKGIQFDQ